MLFNALGYSHTIAEMVETNLVPYSPIYFQGQFSGYPAIFGCQTASDMDWNGSIRNLSCTLEVSAGWTAYLQQLRGLVQSGIPAETSVDPYYLPQPDYDPLRQHGIHSGHAVVVVGYSDSSVVINDPGVGLPFLDAEPLPDPHLRGKNVVVPVGVFRTAVEQSLGTSYLLLTYEPTGAPVTTEWLLLASLDKGLRRLAGDVASYDQELVDYLQPALPVFGRQAVASLAQDMNPATFGAWYQYIFGYMGGNLTATLEFLELSYTSFVGLTGVGLRAPADFYGTVSYPQAPSLCALAESLQARCDTSCALFGRMLDIIEASGGGTSGIVLHLDSLHTTCMEWLAYEDSVAITVADLQAWLSEASSPPVPPARELLVRLWPTPCDGPTSLSWNQPGDGRVSASLYDVGGRAVLTLFDGAAGAGTHVVRWHPRETVSPGVYVLRLRCDPGPEVYERVVVAR
jgi:hypothetical protein